jgi:hypothetical protein
MSRHLTILTFVLLSSFSIGAQATFSYKDIYGNQFYISSSEKFFKKFDTAFFKSNLTGERLQFGTEADTIRFVVRIVGITKVNKYNFKIRLQKYPSTSNPMEILKNMGYVHYRMKVSYKKGEPYCDKIEFLEFEI